MAITFDAESHPSSFAQNNTWTHTVGAGSNCIAIVIAATSGSSQHPTTVTFGGVAMTQLATYDQSSKETAVYYLVDPTSGDNTVVCNWSGGFYCGVTCLTFSGVNQASPFTNNGGSCGTSTTASNTINSTVDDIVVDLVAIYGATATPDGSQVQAFNSGYGLFKLGVSYIAGTSPTATTSWTLSPSTLYAHYSMSLSPSSPTADLDEEIPVLVGLAGCNGVVESLPLFALVNCYVDVPHADVDEDIPIFTISATAVQSTVIAGDCTLPIFTISSLTGYQTDSELEVDLPSLTASASSLTGEIHEGDCDVPSFAISATLLVGGISQGVVALPIFTFVGKTINTGTVSESVPALTISAYAHGPLLHTLDESLPLLQIVATLVQQSTAFRCYVLNTENSAITEYDNFPFNSFCTFKGKHLAAGANGITLLEGNKDNSTDIKAYLNVGNNDFDLPNIKKVTDAYLSMKGDGSYYLTVTSDDGVAHSYLLSATTGDRIKNLKTNVGKGKKGRFFELELSNLAGADFELYDMVLNVELLKRNI
jgi:hypothetical protein